MQVELIRLEQLTKNIIRLFLKPNTQFDFIPGQYINLKLRDGEARPFSIANVPNEENLLELHIRYGQQPDHYLESILSDLNSNKSIEITGSFGKSIFNKNNNSPIILLAGGTGFSPIKSILQAYLNNHYPGPIYCYWGVENRDDLYLNSFMEKLAEKNSQLNYIPVENHPVNPDRKYRTGLVHKAVLTDFTDLSPYQIYAAGPFEMVKRAYEDFLVLGLLPENMHSDTFEFMDKFNP